MRPELTFHTARPRGSTFQFIVQTDPHCVDDGVGFDLGDDAIYETALAAEASDSADFLIDMGDTFMGDQSGSESQTDDLHFYQRQWIYRTTRYSRVAEWEHFHF